MTIRKWHRGTIVQCVKCGANFSQYRPNHLACSYACSYHHQNHRRPNNQNDGRCLRCSLSLNHRRLHAIYCSKTCKSMDHTAKHRAKTRTKGVARRYEIYERDQGKCYMCQQSISLDIAELDHLIPVSKGGSSDPSNIALSCRPCNRRRGANLGEKQFSKLAEMKK
jgi:5-methylcytosine-specific restriction endonuclease McrA